MSKVALVGVLEKMVRDAPYRDLVKTDPETALYRADLTPEERAALAAATPDHLERLGIGADLVRAALGDHPVLRRLEPSDLGAPGGPTGEL